MELRLDGLCSHHIYRVSIGFNDTPEVLLTHNTGLNTTVALKTHRETIPSLPHLGEALSVLNITVPVPQINSPASPGSGDESKPHFIQDATVLISHSSSLVNRKSANSIDPSSTFGPQQHSSRSLHPSQKQMLL